jgi:hypothetical protein
MQMLDAGDEELNRRRQHPERPGSIQLRRRASGTQDAAAPHSPQRSMQTASNMRAWTGQTLQTTNQCRPARPHEHKHLSKTGPSKSVEWAHPCHICIDCCPHLHGHWPRPGASARALGSHLQHLRWDRAHHICTGTGLTAATSAPRLGSPLLTSAPGLCPLLRHLGRDRAHPTPHLRRDCARRWHKRVNGACPYP